MGSSGGKRTTIMTFSTVNTCMSALHMLTHTPKVTLDNSASSQTDVPGLQEEITAPGENLRGQGGERANTGKAPGPRSSEPLFCDVAVVTTPPTMCTTGRPGKCSWMQVFWTSFFFLAALLDCSDAPEHGGGYCSFEAIHFLNARCSQILHTGPLIHQVANHYINKQYIWSGYKSQFQLFLLPALFPLDKSNRYFNMYLCGYTPTYSLTHSIKNTQEAETLLN